MALMAKLGPLAGEKTQILPLSHVHGCAEGRHAGCVSAAARRLKDFPRVTKNTFKLLAVRGGESG